MIETARLDAAPSKPVLLVSSKESAQVAHEAFPGYIVFHYQERQDRSLLDPLSGRKVLLFPDQTEESKRQLAKCSELLLSLGCPTAVVQLNGQAPAWTLASAREEGWSNKALFDFAVKHRQIIEKPKAVQVAPPSAPELNYSEVYGPDIKQPEPQTPSVTLNRQKWGLACNERGVPDCNVSNVLAAIAGAHADGSGLEIWLDTFANQIKCSKRGTGQAVTSWNDVDDINLAAWLQVNAGMKSLQTRVVREAVIAWATRHQRNHVVEWLEMIELIGWDGEDRLEKLMSAGFGAEDNRYTQAVGRCFMIGMIARALAPGCKLDNMPVLEGGQGVGKSSGLRMLGGGWFTEAHEQVTSKDFYISLQGKWLVEISELHAFRRSDVERIKGVITCQVDRYRAPYERHSKDNPRTCVFAGSTNLDDWNGDDTGARRFWPIACGHVSLAWIDLNRDQMFAEAVTRYKRGEKWWDVPQSDAEMEQQKRRPHDIWHDKIENLLEGYKSTTNDWVLDKLELTNNQQGRAEQQRVGSVLRALGWTKKDVRTAGKNKKTWFSPTTEKKS